MKSEIIFEAEKAAASAPAVSDPRGDSMERESVSPVDVDEEPDVDEVDLEADPLSRYPPSIQEVQAGRPIPREALDARNAALAKQDTSESSPQEDSDEESEDRTSDEEMEPDI